MSVEAIVWALSVPVGGSAKVILIGIANHAGSDFGEARPAVDTLARYAHCDRRTVQRHLRTLESEGWIVRTGWHAVGGRADRSVAVWRLSGRQDATPPERGDKTERGDIDAPNGATPVPPEPSLGTVPSLEQSIETRKETAELPLLIDAKCSEPSREGAREADRSFSHKRRKVSAEAADAATRLLDVFNDATGSRFKARKRTGEPTPELKQVAGAILDREDVSEGEWAAGIRATAASPPSWIDGPWIVGHMFGEKASAHTLARARPVSVPIAASRGGWTAQDMLRIGGAA